MRQGRANELVIGGLLNQVKALEKELAETRAKLEALADRCYPDPRSIKTPAEQAVLDAMAEIPDGTISAYLHTDLLRIGTSVEAALRAELARRGG